MMQSSCQQSFQKEKVHMPVVMMQAIKEDMEQDFRNAETNPLYPIFLSQITSFEIKVLAC
jgi:hypothetical protein